MFDDPEVNDLISVVTDIAIVLAIVGAVVLVSGFLVGLLA